MKTPPLSIIIPVYNADKYLTASVQSILNQTYSDFELIIINDGSTDNSEKIINSFSDNRIKYLINDQNKGIVYTRNRGLKEALGDFVGMLDADDVVYPDKFEKQIAFLKSHPEYVMVGSWVKFIDENGERLPSGWKLKAPTEKIPALMLFKNYFLQSAVLYKRECFGNHSFTEGFDILEDYLLWYQLLKDYKAWNLPHYLVDYRLHPEGVTKKHDEERREKERNVFRIQLKDMGMDATAEELALHQALREGAPVQSPEELKKAEQWLLKLLKINCVNKVYDTRIFLKVVFERWLKVCKNSRFNKLKLIRNCLTSRITTAYFSGCKSISSFDE